MAQISFSIDQQTAASVLPMPSLKSGPSFGRKVSTVGTSLNPSELRLLHFLISTFIHSRIVLEIKEYNKNGNTVTIVQLQFKDTGTANKFQFCLRYWHIEIFSYFWWFTIYMFKKAWNETSSIKVRTDSLIWYDVFICIQFLDRDQIL